MDHVKESLETMKEKLHAAKHLVHEENYAEARAELEKVNALSELGLRELYQLALLLSECSSWDRAGRVYEEIALRESSPKKALARLGEVFLKMKDVHREIDFYERFLKEKDLREKGVKAQILSRLKELYEIYEGDEANTRLQEIVESLYRHDTNNKELIYDLCTLYLEAGRNDEKALALYEKAFRITPERPELLTRLTSLYRAQGKNRWRHLDICLESFRKNPEDLENLKYLASVFMEKDETIDDAIEDVYRLALEKQLFPRGALLFHLGLFHEKHRRSAEAREHYEKSAGEGFGEPGHYPLQRLGLIYLEAKETEKAKSSLTAQWENYPDDELTSMELRKMLFSPSMRDQLQCSDFKTAKKLVNLKPLFKDYIFLGYGLLEKCREFQLALECFQGALTLEPSSIEALKGIKECFAGLGNFAESAQTVDIILKRKLRKDDEIQYNLELASMYSKNLKNPEQALASLDRILAIDPANYKAHKEKIALCESIQDKGKYHECLMAAWSIYFSDAELLERLREYYESSKKEGALTVIDEMLLFIGKGQAREASKEPEGIKKVSLDDLIHEKERKGKDKLQFYLDALKIATDEGVPDKFYSEIRSDVKDFGIADKKGWMETIAKCAKLMGETPLVFCSYEGTRCFWIKAFNEGSRSIIVVKPGRLENISPELRNCLIAQGIAHLKLEHPRHYKQIQRINHTINEYVDKAIGFLSSSMRGYSDFLKAPLIFLLRSLKQEKMRKTILEKLLRNVEGLMSFPGLSDVLTKVLNLVLFQESSAADFIRGGLYSVDRIAYATTGDLQAATLAILCDEIPEEGDLEARPAKRKELAHNERVKDRVAELWKFAIECEV
jgi:tetratricopeptide (TPR) repeat protein